MSELPVSDRLAVWNFQQELPNAFLEIRAEEKEIKVRRFFAALEIRIEPIGSQLIALSGAEDLTYNGTEQSPEVSVTLNLWGYSHTYGNPADYTVTYTDATNAGETAKAVITSTGAGDLLAGSASKTFVIQPAAYSINVSDGKWTVAHGETQLLSKLPPATISIESCRFSPPGLQQ